MNSAMFKYFVLILLTATFACNQSEQTNKRISKSQLEDMFRAMKNGGMNPNNELVWSYYFIDKDTLNLHNLANKLVAGGYTFVAIINIEGDGGPTNEFRLHMSKVEKHSVESLHQRNSQFYKLCESLGVMEYDGMEVGK